MNEYKRINYCTTALRSAKNDRIVSVSDIDSKLRGSLVRRYVYKQQTSRLWTNYVAHTLLIIV